LLKSPPSVSWRKRDLPLTLLRRVKLSFGGQRLHARNTCRL